MLSINPRIYAVENTVTIVNVTRRHTVDANHRDVAMDERRHCFTEVKLLQRDVELQG